MVDLAIWRLLVSLGLGSAFTYGAGELFAWLFDKDRIRGALTLTEFGATMAAAALVFAVLSGISLRIRWKSRTDR